MLQQTQVERVIPKYHEFLARFPSLQALAKATPAEVIRAWRPLGYNLRAVRLRELAMEVVEHHGGTLPQEPQALQRLKGIGPYTAAAVACFAFGQELPVIDTNVRRVLRRWFSGVDPVAEKALGIWAQEVLPPGQASAWNQALMDLGATVCTSHQPRCSHCPLQEECRAAPLLQHAGQRLAEARAVYRASSPFPGSRRYYRGRIVDYLRTLEPGTTADLPTLAQALGRDSQPPDLLWLAQLLEALAQEGLVRLHHHQGPQGEALAASLPE